MRGQPAESREGRKEAGGEEAGKEGRREEGGKEAGKEGRREGGRECNAGRRVGCRL